MSRNSSTVSMNEIVYSQDGWGAGNVTQNHTWDAFLSSPRRQQKLQETHQILTNNLMNISNKRHTATVREVKSNISGFTLSDLIAELGLNDNNNENRTYYNNYNNKKSFFANNNSFNQPRKEKILTATLDDLWTPKSGNSQWVLLTELPPGIDRFSLRALFARHGDIHYYNLFDKQNMALCKYLSMRDSRRAFQKLNYCLVQNRIVKAEMPCEEEVENIFNFLGLSNPLEIQYYSFQ